MAGVRFTELQSRPMEFLDCTSVTLAEFPQLVPPFETAFQCQMAAWRMDGKPRTARRFTVDKNCPLRTPRGSVIVYADVCQDLRAASGPGSLVRHGPGESQPVDSRPLARAVGGAPRPW